MKFQGIETINIDQLGLSQIYLSADKIASVAEWFDPRCLDNFQPLPVHDFGNNTYTLTDGHSRAYIAYKCGVAALPVVYDNDNVVAGPIGQMLYRADIDWCKRFGLSHIKQLESRILSKSRYQKLWIGRCGRCYNLFTQTSDSERMKLQKIAPDLFLYGASEDRSVLFFEDADGNLFFYRDNVLLPEDLQEGR